MAKKQTLLRIATAVIALVMLLSTLLAVSMSATGGGAASALTQSGIRPYNGSLINNKENYYNSSVIYKLPDTVEDTDELSLIIKMQSTSLMDGYKKDGDGMTFAEYAETDGASSIRSEIAKKADELKKKLDGSGVEYELGRSYDTVLSGFEVIITAKDFESICKTLSSEATVIVGEEYEVAETKLVENEVDIDENTGIFDSSDFKYNGSGTIVAVLDTGLDYYHTAFSDSNFAGYNTGNYSLTFSEVSSIVSDLRASEMQSGLTASDVYIGNKVPYAFDYADSDSDVYPLLSNHGTHVAGVVAGHDDVITGAAPGAQLAIMKIFSDVMATSRTSWIIAALEDCVALGVDVINMSIGTTCGFSRETDAEAISGVYDDIRELGISLVVAASNSYNSTYGSDKNGNLGLTSNPDSATVGSPSTYLGALSVASIEGAKTPYLLDSENKIIYFIESTDRVSEEKDFVDELLASDTNTLTIEYITIPGAGRSADYTGIDVKGKIALVRRGSTTFEEKAAVAKAKGAAGVIIYNNVSGDIKMNVGETDLPVCSISQDVGERLAKVHSGKITISRGQSSGPFISDFSSWGPTPDLRIKPEITAHGGSILSAVPGQSYERISGTSMATPNISGLTALLRQYVIERFPELEGDSKAINATVNRLMMSTADIMLGKNGLPYAVRKQGAGLANLNDSALSNAYIVTYDRLEGYEMDKSKIELGDDPEKTGKYTLTFSVKNFGTTALSYDISAYVMTEGVSDTKTSKGDTTVTETAYILGGAMVDVVSCEGGALSGKKITVNAGTSAKVTLTITLSESDKKYLDESFENGMYVEGFVMLDALDEGSTDLNVPYLAFYGDWTVAPLFDIDYFETNKDELDDSLDLLDKTLPDAYATRPIGGTTDDYMSYLGSYYFIQKPGTTMIAADRKYIAISNQTDALNSLRFVWAGMLRSAEKVIVTITDDATGEVVYETTDYDIRKSFGEGGPIAPANIDIEFSAIENNLKNNMSYTVSLTGYVDYGDGGLDTNLNNTFTFPLVADFQAPVIPDCEFYTEYDRSEKKTRLFAKVAVYDNHYSMAMQFGYIGTSDAGEPMFYAFDRYPTQVYSDFNSTSYVTYELTDYIDEIMASSYNKNTFAITTYDYAINAATYEIPLPDNYEDFYFDDYEDVYYDEPSVALSPNEVFTLTPFVYPETEWADLIEYKVSDSKVARIVGNQVIALKSGKAKIYATYTKPDGTTVRAELRLTVRGPEDEGYAIYDKPVAESFTLTGYYTNKAFYMLNADEKEIGDTGNDMKFVGNNYSLSLYPSESVTLRYKLDAYFPEDTEVVFEAGNENIVKVNDKGQITAVAEGFSSVTIKVLLDGRSTYYSQSVSIEVKEPYVTTGPSLTHYYGNGGVVTFPKTLAITQIGEFAFSNFNYVVKEPGEMHPEDTTTMKAWFIGDDTITEVYIPEGVERIGAYAFANLTKLETVHFPSTLETIDYGAFFGCKNLKKLDGIENVKFINQSAFSGCAIDGTLDLKKAVAISSYAFAYNTSLDALILPETIQSVGAYAFTGNTSMKSLEIKADIVKLGQYAFSNCSELTSVELNSAVIPAGAFLDCKKLESVTLGKDVAVIGEYAFGNTIVEEFVIAEDNTAFTPGVHEYILSSDESVILLVAPGFSGDFSLNNPKVKSVASGAFSGNTYITSVNIPSVTYVSTFAFSECTALKTINLGTLEYIGDFAFQNTAITTLPSFSGVDTIGKYAFARTNISSVIISDGMEILEGAFASCEKLSSVVIGDNVTVGKYAFLMDSNIYPLKDERNSSLEVGSYRQGDINIFYYDYKSPITSLTIGDNADLGYAAFLGAAKLTGVTLGNNVKVGDYAFYNCASLNNIDLSSVVYIGEFAFSGMFSPEYTDSALQSPIWDTETNNYQYRYYTPKFKHVDLSAVTYIGDSAFLCCKEIEEVVLGNGLTEIAKSAFGGATKLSRINLENIVTVGDESFAECAIEELDLSSATYIGKYAFCYNGALDKVTLAKENIEIAEGAFSYCKALDELYGEEGASVIGDYAFAYTALTDIDLTAVTALGTHAFMKEEYAAFSVKLGEVLEKIGDNPFAMCEIAPFSKTVSESFNDKDYQNVVYTFDITDTVKIIDGSIYRVVPYGLELITWCGDSKVTVADNTVRIGAMAFAGDDVTSVILPYTVSAIGHKAFYKCDKLSFISFASYDAPRLEEEYDEIYFSTFENIPCTGTFEFEDYDGNLIIHEGLEIVPFYIWNVSSMPTNTFYGASFVDYIGHIDNKIAMICPVNGNNYNSFIFGQYFDTVINGATAADDITLAAIEAISKIPDAKTIKLTDKPIVEHARALYDMILTFDQRALVDYQVLTTAENRIKTLEALANKNDNTTPPEVVTPTEPESDNTLAIVLTVIGIVLVIAGAAVAAFFLLKEKGVIAAKASDEKKEADASDSDEPTGDTQEASDNDVTSASEEPEENEESESVDPGAMSEDEVEVEKNEE
ncbi:MAG: leucine-rich repeat protein [Clostridia bacterium]|nr:leucine-rich repeat protein [Clostridia bacterium]